MNLFDVMTGKISRMSHVNRYSSFPVNRRENVAEHSWWVSVIAYAIALDLEAQGERVNTEHVLRYALLHDLSEVVSGDVIRSYKHSTQAIKEAMANADLDNTGKMLDEDPYDAVGDMFFNSWRYAKAESTLEGQIVSFADMAAVAFYCREEDRSGNRAIRAVLREAYETWFHKYHDHGLLGQYIGQMFPQGRFSDMLREVTVPPAQSFQVRPMMVDHSEGETAAYDSAAWPTREVPLG